MPEPLNAPEPFAMSHAASTATTPAKGRERRRQASAVAEYAWPSACTRCIPVVRIVSADFFVTVTETAHETDCPNHPIKHTHSLSKESTTW